MENLILELENNFDEEEQRHYNVVLFHVFFIYLIRCGVILFSNHYRGNTYANIYSI
jgi:hypothetical protein